MKTKEATKKLSLTKDFEHFIDYHTELKGDEYKYVKNLFGQQHIKKTIRASLVLIIWSFVNSFVDATMIGWSFVEVAMKGFSILHFVPWLLMVSFNMVVKYFFLGWLDTGNNFSHKQKVLATIPSVGVFLFLASVLAQEKLFLKVTRQYLRYVKRRGVKFILRLLGFSTLDY